MSEKKDIRRLTAKELADLSTNWGNARVDTTKYYQCALQAWEVSKEIYEKGIKAGLLYQEADGRYYLGD